jgi:SAM-dependent MidA family methyltransferase
VGPLFGAVIANALDGWWDELGCPDHYVVADAGAGPGTLARSILAAAPRCGSALRLVLVERSVAQRAHHPQGVESRSDLPSRADVILANELLDNLPFDIVEHDGTQWREVLVDWRDGRFVEVAGPALDLPLAGTRLPLPRAAAAWVADARQRCLRLVAFDYTATATTIGPGWLRCYRGHESGLDPLEEPGSRDITADVLLDALPTPRRLTDQAAFLRAHGLDDLVREGRQTWKERAHVADLAALTARSRVAEADALTDPSGLGGFTVAEWWAAP